MEDRVTLGLADQQDSQNTILAVLSQIHKIVEAYAVGNPLSESAVTDFCEELIELNKGYAIEEVVMFRKMAIRGEFGEVYNRLDVPTLWIWWRKYEALRSKEVIALNNQRASADAESGRHSKEYVLKAYENMRKAEVPERAKISKPTDAEFQRLREEYRKKEIEAYNKQQKK